MKRIVLWLASTVTIMVLLFGYHTSTNKTSPRRWSSSRRLAQQQPSSSPPGTTQQLQPAATPRRAGPTPGRSRRPAGGRSRYRSPSSGKITKVTVLQQPNGNRKDEEINAMRSPY